MNMRLSMLLLLAGLVSGAAVAAEPARSGLRAPADFNSISNRAARSAAIFTEVARVLEHPRCINCHPAVRMPTQGDDMHPHSPAVQAGPQDRGTREQPCSSCHGTTNTPTLGQVVKSIPGTAHWLLAPASMAWQGLTTGEICAQLKDPARNGGRSLQQIQTHVNTDVLVLWGWDPGEGRAPVPGTHAGFTALVAEWIKTGAECPKSR